MEIERKDRGALKKKLEGRWPTDIAYFLREELETAWLRGYLSGFRAAGLVEEGSGWVGERAKQEAADYAERVVGGPAAPQGPPAPYPF